MSRRPSKKHKLTAKRRARLSLPERLDIALLERLAPLLRRRSTKQVGQVGQLADEPPLFALSAATAVVGTLAGHRALRRAGLRMLLAHAAATGLKELGKNHIDRSRPDALLRKKRYRMTWGRSRSPDWRSFPSGHTAGAFAVAGALVREAPDLRRPAYLVAAVLGALQVLRHAHFPGDVAAGTVLGLVAKTAANAVTDRLIGAPRAPQRIGAA